MYFVSEYGANKAAYILCIDIYATGSHGVAFVAFSNYKRLCGGTCYNARMIVSRCVVALAVVLPVVNDNIAFAGRVVVGLVPDARRLCLFYKGVRSSPT